MIGNDVALDDDVFFVEQYEDGKGWVRLDGTYNSPESAQQASMDLYRAREKAVRAFRILAVFATLCPTGFLAD